MGSSHHSRILCFGDSLTEGYTKMGDEFVPYSDALEKLLRKCGHKVNVQEDGMSGDQITGGFSSRMIERCKGFTLFLVFFFFLLIFLLKVKRRGD